MSDWFFMLGEPLGAAELRQVRQYLRGLEISEELPIESVPDWSGAARAIATPEWDRRWWDAEERERRRLLAKASDALGERPLLDSLSHALGRSGEAAHGAAAVQAARTGCRDAALIRAAAGALSLALYLGRLAELCGELEVHPFLLKQALFAGGHWPLGIVHGRFYVF